MSGPFDRKYTAAQCEAAAEHYAAHGNAREVSRLAAAGELKHRGEPMPAFEMPAPTIAAYGGKLKRRQQGRAAPAIAAMPARDAIENLRLRLITMAHEGIAVEEGKRARDRDTARIREWTRCIFEAARLPGPSEPRPPGSGARDETGKRAPQTQGGAEGALLKAHRAETARDDTHSTADTEERTTTGSSTHRLNGSEQHAEPGALTHA